MLNFVLFFREKKKYIFLPFWAFFLLLSRNKNAKKRYFQLLCVLHRKGMFIRPTKVLLLYLWWYINGCLLLSNLALHLGQRDTTAIVQFM